MPGALIISPSDTQSPLVGSPVKTVLSPTKATFCCPFTTTQAPEPDTSDPHRFIPPTSDSSRAPCPALNALANHGYLPRSGRHITFHNIMTSLEEAFGLSPGFGLFMAIGSFTLLRRRFDHPFDLHETAIHNLIEHNASLVHDDADPNQVNCDGVEYAPIAVDPVLFRRFLSIACPLHPGSENVYTTSIIAQYRVEREKESKIPPDALHAELGRAEFSMIIQIFGKPDEQGGWYVDESVVAEFFRNQRFPEGWRPARTLHLIDAVRCTNDIRHQMEEIRKSRPKWDTKSAEAIDEHEWFCKAKKWFIDVLNIHFDTSP